MSWRDQLQPASFRGVPFEVESDDASFGRRVEVHEYPSKDIPLAEDLGRKAREKNLVAFVIGADYMAKRDALLEACEKAGAGELVHPYYGRMMVTLTDVRVSHSMLEGGMCRFNLQFVESGELTYPQAVNATSEQSLEAADALESSAVSAFTENFSVDGLSEFAVKEAQSTFSDALSTIESVMANTGLILADPLSLFKQDLGALLYEPATLASRFLGLFSKGNHLFNQLSGLANVDLWQVLNVLPGINLVNQFRQVVSLGNTPTTARMAKNKSAIHTLIRQGLIAQSAGLLASQPLPVYDDAQQVKKALLETLDVELNTANDTNYLALKTVRVTTHADVTARTQNAARLKNITPNEVLPGIVLAYDLYEDVTREAEIIDRNKVRHPGFVPATTIKVLSA